MFYNNHLGGEARGLRLPSETRQTTWKDISGVVTDYYQRDLHESSDRSEIQSVDEHDAVCRRFRKPTLLSR
jgi:hypothetical protein